MHYHIKEHLITAKMTEGKGKGVKGGKAGGPPVCAWVVNETNEGKANPSVESRINYYSSCGVTQEQNQ